MGDVGWLVGAYRRVVDVREGLAGCPGWVSPVADRGVVRPCGVGRLPVRTHELSDVVYGGEV